MRGNQQMRKYHCDTCPHACSRVSAPLANRPKYSDSRNGLCASSSSFTASNQSVMTAAPPSARELPHRVPCVVDEPLHAWHADLLEATPEPVDEEVVQLLGLLLLGPVAAAGDH